MKQWRVTYVIEKGSHVGLIQHAIQGELVQADGVEIQDGAVVFFNFDSDAAIERTIVKAWGPGTWRTIMPVVGAAAPTEKAHEDPGRRTQKERSV